MELATYSSTLAWKTPWTEEPGGLLSMGLQRVGHNFATKPQNDNNSENDIIRLNSLLSILYI